MVYYQRLSLYSTVCLAPVILTHMKGRLLMWPVMLVVWRSRRRWKELEEAVVVYGTTFTWRALTQPQPLPSPPRSPLISQTIKPFDTNGSFFAKSLYLFTTFPPGFLYDYVTRLSDVWTPLDHLQVCRRCLPASRAIYRLSTRGKSREGELQWEPSVMGKWHDWTSRKHTILLSYQVLSVYANSAMIIPSTREQTEGRRELNRAHESVIIKLSTFFVFVLDSFLLRRDSMWFLILVCKNLNKSFLFKPLIL